jgi:formate dehydrogenase subunit delta
MLPADLIRMSTQIAQFFEPYPADDAVAGVEDHLVHFWDPSMRAELLAIRQSDPGSLHPLVAAAADRLLAAMQP